MTKDAASDAITSGLEQMNSAIQTWWTFPYANAANPSGTPMQQTADFVTDLQKIYSDAFERQRDLLRQGMTDLTSWTPANMQASQPQDALQAPLKMMASMLDASSKRAEVWTDMFRQVGARYAVLAHQLAQDCDQATAATTTEKTRTAPGSA